MGRAGSMGLKDIYLARREAELNEWELEIARFEVQATRVLAHGKAAIHEQLASLRLKQTTVREKLHELKLAQAGAWETVKIGLERAWNDCKCVQSRVGTVLIDK